MARSRPNILLITTDQQRFDHLGLKGVKGIDTPNLDRLGREGIHFDRAYTCCPVCTPARVSLLTGQYPSVHGAYTIGVTADPFPTTSIGQLFYQAGYQTALFGKTHFVRRADEALHLTGRADPSPEYFRTFQGPYLGFQKVLVSRGHTTNQNPDQHYRIFLEDAKVPYADWYPDVHGKHDHNACGLWNIPAEYHDTSWVSQNIITWIRENKENPWFCWANFQDPHEPHVCPDPWYSMVRKGEIHPFDGFRPGEFENKPAFYRSVMEKRDWLGFEDEFSVPCVNPKPKLEEKALEALQATLGMIAFIDDRMGAILKTLEETGQIENTIVVFTSDHGEMHGHHGFWGKGLTAYEDCQRIPFLVWGPGYVSKRGTSQALVNLVDLPKTFLSLSGIDIPQGMQGVDLSPLWKGEVDQVQDSTLIELRATENIYQQTLVTSRYKLVLYQELPDGEIYDLESDPDQYCNLWNSPSHQELKRDLLYQFAKATLRKDGKVTRRKAFA